MFRHNLGTSVTVRPKVHKITPELWEIAHPFAEYFYSSAIPAEVSRTLKDPANKKTHAENEGRFVA